MEKLRNYLNENQTRYLNIVKAQKTSPRVLYREAEKKLRKFQAKRNDVKLGYTGGKYLQAIKIGDDIWYTELDNGFVKCVSMYLFASKSVEQLIRSYRKK